MSQKPCGRKRLTKANVVQSSNSATARLTELDKQRLELRSHVLSLREGERAMRELLSRQFAEPQASARHGPKPRRQSAGSKRKARVIKKARSKNVKRRQGR